MKILTINIVLVFILLTSHSVGQQAGNILDKKVEISAKNITIEALLDSISVQHDIFFSYDPTLIKADSIINFNTINLTIKSILDEITSYKKTTYNSINNQIVIYPLNPVPIIEEDKFIIEGKVIDSKNKRSLPYCNVSVGFKGIGTMTNKEGNFVLKIPNGLKNDTLIFSCIGFNNNEIKISDFISSAGITVKLYPTTFQLKEVDIKYYNPINVLDSLNHHLKDNYQTNYVLLTTFYRELVKENNSYTDVSEAVMQVMKAPYNKQLSNDLVKFIKGRKSADVAPFNDIKFKLKGGPHYITKLDIVKTNESFISQNFRHLYNYNFEKIMKYNGRETVVISFKPVYQARDYLYRGKLFIDIATWGVARAEFEITKQGLKDARRYLIEKRPRHFRVDIEETSYTVSYKLVQGNWYLYTASNTIDIVLKNRKKREKTRFTSVSEILTTRIEQGDLEKFSRREVFRSNDFFTEQIKGYDPDFWKNYNTITPESDLVKAIKNFTRYNLLIQKQEK